MELITIGSVEPAQLSAFDPPNVQSKRGNNPSFPSNFLVVQREPGP